MSAFALATRIPRVHGRDQAQDEERRRAERDVIRRAQGGDMQAFEQLYRDHVGRVHAICMRLACDAALAEELTQDVFVRAWQKLGSFRFESALSTWLYPLAVNVALSERRSRRRRTSRITSTDDLTPFEKPGRKAQPESAIDLERAMATLPAGARNVFVLHDVLGWKHEEIAQGEGIVAGTSKAQLHRARRLLRDALRG
jgi:RNA polymerase sigma-70 factor (ECF subfamily)